MNRRGPKAKRWEKTWKEDAKPTLEILGDHFCEFRFPGCRPRGPLDPCHAVKRSFFDFEAPLDAPENPINVALGCRFNCHHILDVKFHHEGMKVAVMKAIERRSVPHALRLQLTESQAIRLEQLSAELPHAGRMSDEDAAELTDLVWRRINLD